MPNSTSEVAYYIACPNVIELNLAYGADNKSHKVQLVFIPNQNYYGYCTSHSKKAGLPVRSLSDLGGWCTDWLYQEFHQF